MSDLRLLRLLLTKTPLSDLERFAQSRVQLPKRPRKKQIIDLFTSNQFRLDSEDIEELESIVSGNPGDRGFSVFLYKVPDAPPREQLVERISQKARETALAEKSISLVANEGDGPVILDYRFEETGLVLTTDGRYELGLQVRVARIHLYPETSRAEVYTGSSERAENVVKQVGLDLAISFQRRVRHDLSAFRMGTLAPQSVLFLELLYNRLDNIGRIENVEKVMLDSKGVEENIHGINIKGHHLFDSAKACTLLLEGQKIAGVRMQYRLTVGSRDIVTYVTLVLTESAGLKIIIAQQNWPPEMIIKLFHTIRHCYETLVEDGAFDHEALSAQFAKMQATVAAG